MIISHIGYAVKDINSSVEKFKALGFIEKGPVIIEEKYNIKIKFMENCGYLVELVSPYEDNNPVNNILKKVGNTPYHICYGTYKFELDIKNLKSKGYIQVGKPIEANAFNNKRVVFMYEKDMGLIELLEL